MLLLWEMFPDGLYFLFEGMILGFEILAILFHNWPFLFEELLGTVFSVIEGFNLEQIRCGWLIATFLGNVLFIWRQRVKLFDLLLEWGGLWFSRTDVSEGKFTVPLGFVSDECSKIGLNIFFWFVAMSLGRS